MDQGNGCVQVVYHIVAKAHIWRLIMIHTRRVFHALFAAVLFGICAGPAIAQTWTGASNGLWNVASNWSSNPSVPVSGTDTALIFNASGVGGTLLTQNLVTNPFLLNVITFNKIAPAYMISGNALDFRTSSVNVAPQIVQNSASAMTFATPMTLTSTLTIGGGNSGAVNLNGVLSGTGGLIDNAAGTVVLGNGSNSFTGGVFVNSGRVLLGSGTAIPTGRNVTVGATGTFSIGSLSNTSATAIGTVAVNGGGTFAVPSGGGSYFLNKLAMDGSSDASTLDFTGSTGATLHFVNSGAGISVNGVDNIWTGAGSSRIVNDTAAPIDISLSQFGALASTLRLANGSSNQGFRVTGDGAFMVLNNTGNTANFMVDGGATISVTDMNFLGTGALALANTSSPPASMPGRISYGGLTTSSAKGLTLGSGGGQIQVVNADTNLTLNGVINESVAGQPLLLSGNRDIVPPTLTLTANNTYTGPTTISPGLIVSVATMPNGGVAGPLGASAAGPGNLALSGTVNDAIATVQYTGPTTSTDRGMSINGAGAVEVTNALTTLTLNGQVFGVAGTNATLVKTGPGTLVVSSPNNFLPTSTAPNYNVSGGRLMLGVPTAIPVGGNVTVQSGAEFNTNGFANQRTTALGTVTLNGGTFRIPTGSSQYFLNKLTTDSNGGTIDTTGMSTTSNGGLVFTNPGAAIMINGNTTWTGPGNSFIGNIVGGELPITIAPNVTLTSGLGLVSFSPSASNPIRITGGGTLYLNGLFTFAAVIRVNQARLRLDNVQNTLLFVQAVTLDAGTLQYGGPSFSSRASGFVLGAGGGTIDVMNPATELVLGGPIAGSEFAPLTKIGPGTLGLTNTSNSYLGGLIVSNGVLEVGNDNQLGLSSPTVNPAGTLRYTQSSTSARTFNLNGGTLEVPGSVMLTLNGATVNGGFMRGAGTFTFTGGVMTAGVNTASGATINQTGAATVINFTNNASFTNATGQVLTWSNGTNTSAGRMTVNGTANVSDFVSDGSLTISAGGTLNNSGSPMVLGGGSTTFVGSAAAPGGAINLGGQTLEVRGGLLANNGIINGTVNVHFNGSVTGAGTFGPVNVFENGRFAPGAGSSPAVFSPAVVAASNASFAQGTSLAIEIGGKSAGTGFDQVNVASAAVLAGTLDVTTTNNFIPAALDAFKVLSFASRSGAFSTYTGMTPGNGLAYAPIYGGNDLSLIATLPGDATLDGKVDFLDLAKLAQNYNSTVSGLTDSTWLLGDFNYDGKVDFLDLAKLAQNYNTSALPSSADFSAGFQEDWAAAQASASVPEPAIGEISMLMALLAAGVRRRRGR
jgi:fibronectin-binding autotransporter adhesin